MGESKNVGHMLLNSLLTLCLLLTCYVWKLLVGERKGGFAIHLMVLNNIHRYLDGSYAASTLPVGLSIVEMRAGSLLSN